MLLAHGAGAAHGKKRVGWMERKEKGMEGGWKEHAAKEERDAACWEVKLQLISSGRRGRWEKAAWPSWGEERKA